MRKVCTRYQIPIGVMRRQENLLKKTDPSADKLFYDLTDRAEVHGVMRSEKWKEEENGVVGVESVYFVE